MRRRGDWFTYFRLCGGRAASRATGMVEAFSDMARAPLSWCSLNMRFTSAMACGVVCAVCVDGTTSSLCAPSMWLLQYGTTPSETEDQTTDRTMRRRRLDRRVASVARPGLKHQTNSARKRQKSSQA